VANPQSVELIVGLGNPGSAYAKTRHNAGAWFVEALCRQYRVTLRNEAKFNARLGQLTIGGQSVRVLISNTYMNHSGQPVGSIAKYFNLAVQNILIAHDELDFPPGDLRLKIDGGHGGHNGLRDIIHHLKSREFKRLRVGIGHPGHKDQVLDYVLQNPSHHDEVLIQDAIEKALKFLPQIVADWQNAMQRLHSVEDESVKK
jgi:peptidyl-tRNA hydrolase, PTH1 family